MKQIVFASLGAAALAGCTTMDDSAATDPATPAVGTPMACNAAAVQNHIGHDATQAMGTAILKDSGARSLRWGPPESAWTMDYREDRVNVRYDSAMKITAVTCG